MPAERTDSLRSRWPGWGRFSRASRPKTSTISKASVAEPRTSARSSGGRLTQRSTSAIVYLDVFTNAWRAKCAIPHNDWVGSDEFAMWLGVHHSERSVEATV